MAHPDSLIQSFPSPQSLLETPVDLPSVVSDKPFAYEDSSATNVSAESELSRVEIPEPEVERHDGRSRAWLRFAGGALLASYVVLGVGGSGHAEAASVTSVSATTTVEAQPQQSDSDWLSFTDLLKVVEGIGAAGTAAAAILGVGTYRAQARQKTEDGFNTALQNLPQKNGGEEREARLHSLQRFAEKPRYAPEVFNAAVKYLRSRRVRVKEIKDRHADLPDDQEKFTRIDRELTPERNADRAALELLRITLPATRRQVRNRERIIHAKRMFTGKTNPIQSLVEQSGGYYDSKRASLVDMRAINLDHIRDLSEIDFEEVDLTGAGLQYNQATHTSFKDSRLCEAKLEGTTFLWCDFRGADLRATYNAGNTFGSCLIDENTKFGNLPDDDPKARHGSNKPSNPEEYRGDPAVILKNLTSYQDKQGEHALSEQEIIGMVHAWQRNGLKLLAGSNHEYFLNEADDPNWTVPAP